MCVHGSLIVLLSVAGAVVLLVLATLATPVPAPPLRAALEVEQRAWEEVATTSGSHRTPLDGGEPWDREPSRARVRRRTKDRDDQANIESSISLWEWLKGRDKPEDNCMLMAIGGVASGGFLTGAFVGAGIGSIFTGPGAIVGGIVGGLVGVFGGLSVGARAGAAACENV